MKKIPFLLVAVLLFSACSMTMEQLLGRPPASSPASISTNTHTPVPTFTPTVPTPTFTGTPTMLAQSVKSPTPFASPTMFIFTQPAVTLLPSSTPLALSTPVKMPGFVSISISGSEFYKGKDCPPVSTKFVVQVADATKVSFVVLFVRFKSKQTGVTSEWTSITMEKTGVGTFTHDLIPLEMKAVDAFENAWVQYQLVATDSNSSQVGRTDIFDERLTLLKCIPPTPFPSVTPTVQVP